MRKQVRKVSAKGVASALGAVVTTVVLAAIVALTVGNPLTSASAAPKPAPPPSPTITSGPSGSITSTSATLAFTDTQSGVAFQCSLDNGAYASCTSPRSYTNLPAATHTFRVTATIGTSNPSAPASRTWTVLDATPPPKPTITKGPDDPSDRSKVKFQLTDTEAGVGFVCSLGDAVTTPPFSPCDKNVQYSGLAPDEHCFRAKAKDAAGNLSAVAEMCFANFEKKTFGITGTTTEPFFPGKSQAVDLVLSNPNNRAIEITTSSITVSSATKKNDVANPDCNGTTNLVVTQGLTGTVIVPANSTRSLSQLLVPQSQWPVLTMPNLSTNQDACKSTTFTINYSGTASSA
jgi:hypothetical protein